MSRPHHATPEERNPDNGDRFSWSRPGLFMAPQKPSAFDVSLVKPIFPVGTSGSRTPVLACKRSYRAGRLLDQTDRGL